VETVLHRHPDVLLAAVVAAPDPKWGETPWAFVELRQGAAADEATLAAFCKQNLAGYKRPRRFVFGPLPRTATGKIQKFLLRQRAAVAEADPQAADAPAPEPSP
jgi:fatty-acyl-CoA synthase